MTVPVLVEQQNGKFTASVLGSPQLRATGETKDQASRPWPRAVAAGSDWGADVPRHRAARGHGLRRQVQG